MRIWKAKKLELALAQERLQALTPAELTEVSGGHKPHGGQGGGHKHHHGHRHHHGRRHHRHHRYHI